MNGIVRTIRRQAAQARGAERFVRLTAGGGVALVAGLWLATLTARWSGGWGLGVALAVLGVAGLAVGIASQIR